MRIIVTAGPTREYIDDVRFISNASSGRMGYAVTAAAAEAGHEVTLLAGPVALPDPPGCRVVRFESVDDLRAALAERFDECDALVMTAAVGDFRPERRVAGKIPRAGGSVTVRLVPTEDILAAVTAGKRSGQVVVAFAVEALAQPGAAAKAQAEMRRKGADFVVVNGPEAMDAPRSRACVLGAAGVVLEWETRTKEELGREIVRLVEEAVAGGQEKKTAEPGEAKGGRMKAEGGSEEPKKQPRDLRERTTEFALRVVRLYCALPKTAEAQVLGKQALRSGTSVGAHYREASRARSKKEFVSKLEGGLAELEETAYWLELLAKAGIVSADRLQPLRDETDELIRILVVSARTAKQDRNP